MLLVLGLVCLSYICWVRSDHVMGSRFGLVELDVLSWFGRPDKREMLQ